MHTRKQIMAKRAAAHAVMDARPQREAIVDDVYYHNYDPAHVQRVLYSGLDPERPQLISNSTGKRVA
jgi:hypothetical protein